MIEHQLCVLPKIESLPCDSQAFEQDFNFYLYHHYGRFLNADPGVFYRALSLTVRDRLMTHWRNTWLKHKTPGVRRAYYLSLEFLMGRALGNQLLNLGFEQPTREAMHTYSLELEEIMDAEPDAGLGNGGLGRLAACFMDSCATLQLPVLGYGIHYEYGMFHQHIENGYQVEEPDHWLRDGNPWELERPEYTQVVHFGGRVEHRHNGDSKVQIRWVNTTDVLAIPYDMPISGFGNNIVNTLRLWKATATDAFNLDEFNAGSYPESVAAKNDAEHITMVLYPNDSSENGKELRLRQQYFLASASLQDVIRQWELLEGPDYHHFAKQNVFQMNDTHPTIAVAELMRILLDQKQMAWDPAWEIVRHCMAYTNHTLLPEALELWPVELMERLLPRLMEIIYEINAHFLAEVAIRWPGDNVRQRQMSIIDEDGARSVRMAHLAIVGSFSVNGVAALHSELLQKSLFHDFYELWPEKFNNKTNGVTPRRWLAYANPELAQLISHKIGDGWIANLQQIDQLKKYTKPKHLKFQQRWRQIKQNNKARLAQLVQQKTGVTFDTAAMFDVQVKRIHEYKRQLLNILHVIHLYRRIKAGDTSHWVNRCVLIAGKAAPGYQKAKTIIKLINSVAEVINQDPDVGDRLKLAFLPNFTVSSMELIAPAADLSQQISTAGKEASGTGNMKLMMNGAITIGTYDGANIEILDAVGEENFFLFGLTVQKINALRGHYHPLGLVEKDPELWAVIHLIESGHFNACEPGIFDDLLAGLIDPNDPWVTLADFRSYIDTQQQVDLAYQDQERWIRMSILNSAASGFFSTDRTIKEYNDDIWKLKPMT